MASLSNFPLIHVARIQPNGRDVVYLFLRKIKDDEFRWFQATVQEEMEIPTTVDGINIEEAIFRGRRHWKNQDVAFRMVNCGFRYTLPERDEHGMNALFNQMVASYSSMNGVYFDQDLGHNCFVQAASQEAYKLWQSLKAKSAL